MMTYLRLTGVFAIKDELGGSGRVYRYKRSLQHPVEYQT